MVLAVRATSGRKQAIIAKTQVPLDRFETIVHPTASVSRMATLGKGVVVLQHVTIANQASIGNHVIILPNSVISHDVVIGDYSCITGGVCISGLVTIGRDCYLGTDSSIIGGVKIGNGCLIGMGAVIRHDVPENCGDGRESGQVTTQDAGVKTACGL